MFPIEEQRLRVGLLSDSFPPIIDGVAQTVKNYASYLHRNHCDVTVATPNYRKASDNYPFPVYRYSSFKIGKRIEYPAGNPFNPEAIHALRNSQFDLLHVHVPFASSILAQSIRKDTGQPVVLTYHTKYQVDIAKRVRNRSIRALAVKLILRNLAHADEVWSVTAACGRALREIGYDGAYHVMENGTDFPQGAASPEAVDALRSDCGIDSSDTFVLLFVGRMMWYKNIRIILDSLRIAKDRGLDFRAIFIGAGGDASSIRRYAVMNGLAGHTLFPGAVYDRELLRVYYSMSDLFLFPSTYDTSGIVVKEAAACNCPALLVRDSCAAEGVEHGFTGFLTEEDAVDCAETLLDACQSRARLFDVGRQAGKHLYLSWETVVQRAYDRYQFILNQ